MLPSYFIPLQKLGVKNLRSIKFLHGYYEPTLLLLYEGLFMRDRGGVCLFLKKQNKQQTTNKENEDKMFNFISLNPFPSLSPPR